MKVFTGILSSVACLAICSVVVRPQRAQLVTQIGHEIANENGIRSMAFSTDDYLLLTSDDNGVTVLWEVITGREIRRFPGTVYRPETFADDSRYVITTFRQYTGFYEGSFDSSLSIKDWSKPTPVFTTRHLFDTSTGQEIKFLSKRSQGYRDMVMSNDRRFVATVEYNNNTVRLWDVRSRKPVSGFVPFRITSCSDESGCALSFSKNGRYLEVVQDVDETEITRFWDSTSGREVGALNGEVTAESGSSRADWANKPIGESYVVQQEGEHNTLRVFSHDGKFLAIATNGSAKVSLWDIPADIEVRTFQPRFSSGRFSISPNDRWIVTYTGLANTFDEDIREIKARNSGQLWDLNYGRIAEHFEFQGDNIDFSPDSRFLVMDDGDNTVLRDLNDYHSIKRFNGNLAIFLEGGRRLSTSDGRYLYLWDVETGKQIHRFKAEKTISETFYPERFLEFSPNGRYGISKGDPVRPMRLWDLRTGRMIRRLKIDDAEPYAIQFAPDGQTVLIGSGPYWDGQEGEAGGGGKLCLFSIPGGARVRCYKGQQFSITRAFFANNNKLVVASSLADITLVWDKVTGRLVKRLAGDLVDVSHDGRKLLTADGNTARLLNLADGTELPAFEHQTEVYDLGFTQHDRLVLTSSQDSPLHFWDARTGIEICRLVTSGDGNWVVIAPDGRFDTNNLDVIEGLYWVLADAPFNTLPLEIFMRDYYEPKLLLRLLKCTEMNNCNKEFNPVRDLSKLNRVQPTVKISNVSVPDADGYVNVTLEVGSAKGKYLINGKEVTRTSGAHDVRLFRDGQIVGSWPSESAQKLQERASKYVESRAGQNAESFMEELRDWRQVTEIKPDKDMKVDSETGVMPLSPIRVKLPQAKAASEIEFTAYAFNEDRVKSQTAKWEWPSEVIPRLPGALPVKSRAYIIAVGVNAYENKDFDLEFAADDARRMSQVISQQIKSSGQYSEVIPVTLVSDYQTKDCQRVITDEQATKENFRAVLEVLSGKNSGRALLDGIENADQLQKATPDDLVLIMYSGHGYADASGSFYFIPYDTGSGSGKVFTEAIRQHSISSEDLSLWLRDLDAGELVMIVDACHSTAAIASQDFKPGPMGIRGLGQLAYDKRMRILTATQSDNVAWEHPTVKQGILTYALLRDGIEARQADYNKDKMITLKEWLEYGVQRVPKLYEEVLTNSVQTFGLRAAMQPNLVVADSQCGTVAGRKELLEVMIGKSKSPATQQPSLFDFTRKKPDLVLWKDATALSQ